MLTDRLLLRQWKDSDLESFAALNADPRVCEFLLKPMSREESAAYLSRIRATFEKNGYGYWAMELRETGELIGFTGLNIPDFDAPFMPAVEIAWRVSSEHWGKGLATEAAKASLGFAFETLKLREVLSFTVPANLRSLAVMKKIGMNHVPSADFHHPRVPEGHPLRWHLLYRIENR